MFYYRIGILLHEIHIKVSFPYLWPLCRIEVEIHIRQEGPLHHKNTVQEKKDRTFFSDAFLFCKVS